jgi:hypothetical protein
MIIMLYLLSGVCIGCLIGSIVERVISFAKLRSEISDVIDKIDGRN